jgi:predicted dehydrogenase
MPVNASGDMGLGLVGAGGYAAFCLEAFSGLDGVRLVAAARARRAPIRRRLQRLGVPLLDDYRRVIEHPEVDVVYVATPPASHAELALSALEAGRHVLCEKPPALTADDAERMRHAARRAERFCVAALVLAYSPVADAVRRTLRDGVLGEPLAAAATNCAADSGLPADHWFWDRGVSGGIFVEHGVHFFDLYRRWLGPAEVLAAGAERRGQGGVEDRVWCALGHAGGAVATHYHGFDQLACMDRTDHRIVCALGDMQVCGWVPLSVRIDAAVDADGLRRLREDIGEALTEQVEALDVPPEGVLGRGRRRRVDRRVRLRLARPQPKLQAYADCARRLLADQLAWARDRSHARRVTEADGLAALHLALAADRLARRREPTDA